MSKEYRVAVAGATGAVGRAMRDILAERDFPVKELVPLATAKSAGMKLDYRGQEVVCQELTPASFEGIDLAWIESHSRRRRALSIDKYGI